jgi:hypothetical protein
MKVRQEFVYVRDAGYLSSPFRVKTCQDSSPQSAVPVPTLTAQWPTAD